MEYVYAPGIRSLNQLRQFSAMMMQIRATTLFQSHAVNLVFGRWFLELLMGEIKPIARLTRDIANLGDPDVNIDFNVSDQQYLNRTDGVQ